MAIQTDAGRDAAALGYTDAAALGAVYTTAPGGSAGTEPAGIYERVALTWTETTPGLWTAPATFDVPAGTTLVGAGVHKTDGTYLDGAAVTSQNFATDGQYLFTFKYTQA